MISTVDIDLLLEDLACALTLFLTSLFGKKDLCKIAAIRQSIMHCARPLNLMMPFSLFLRAHLHSQYGSSYLVEQLSQFRFCKEYHKILRYEKNSTLTSETRKLFINENQTAEFFADNVDDDSVNEDGRDTIPIMGMIVALSPAESNDRLSIPRNIISNAQLSELSSNLTFNFKQ